MTIVKIVKNKCLGLAKDDEGKAFFQKMIGDYYRYVAESAKGKTLEEVKKRFPSMGVKYINQIFMFIKDGT
jgi:hypothetical protein